MRERERERLKRRRKNEEERGRKAIMQRNFLLKKKEIERKSS